MKDSEEYHQTDYMRVYRLRVLPVASPPAAHAQTTDSLFNVSVILPGMTQSIDIRQAAPFPLGCPQFFIAVLGKGTLGISLRKNDVAGDVIFMTGVASSSAGTIPHLPAWRLKRHGRPDSRNRR